MQNAGDKRGDFAYMVVDRIFRNMTMNPSRQIVFWCYNMIKNLTTSDTQMYDIDPSLAIVETVPLRLSDHTEDDLRELLNQSRSETDSVQ